MKIPRENPIKGITSRDGVLYAGVRGAVYECDDRWVDEGPTETLDKSVYCRSRVILGTDVLAPLQDDYIRATSSFDTFSKSPLSPTTCTAHLSICCSSGRMLEFVTSSSMVSRVA